MQRFIFFICCFFLSFSSAIASDLKLSWGNLDGFTDVVERGRERKEFRALVQSEFTHMFYSLANQLPENFCLVVKITDIDLAGRSSVLVPVDRDQIDWPRINFHYELRNATNEIIAQGEESLSDPGYARSIRKAPNYGPFEKEERMLNDWFRLKVRSGLFDVKNLMKVSNR